MSIYDNTLTEFANDAVVWKNINGYYAVTKIVSIKDDSRGDTRDELECQYVIFK